MLIPGILCVRCVHHRLVQATNEDYCVRPVELRSPDYVRGTTHKALGGRCEEERRALPPSCGVSGVYFLAKDGDPVVGEGV